MTNRELGNAARQILKDNGFNLRYFSVTAKYAGYEQVLTIKAKVPGVDCDRVKELVRKFRQVDYCELT